MIPPSSVPGNLTQTDVRRHREFCPIFSFANIELNEWRVQSWEGDWERWWEWYNVQIFHLDVDYYGPMPEY